MTKRVLSIATLYPNAHLPRFGTFVARQMEALAARADWEVTLINPIGVPPVPLGRYRALANAAVSGVEHGVDVHRPRFTLIPGVGGRINPAMIVRGCIGLARRLHAKQPFDLVDAQFFYPDGPAAAQIASALQLPLSIKARGADISLWGHKRYSHAKMLSAARQAAGLLCVSEALADDMVAIGLPRSKITVHYTGLDHTLFKPLDRGRMPRQARRRLWRTTARRRTAAGQRRRADPKKRTGFHHSRSGTIARHASVIGRYRPGPCDAAKAGR